ncbi:MAG: tRNA lysidine(34) synthetase TilS [Sedimentisphaerales bacterium]|nr:tRNA lysidine(34) synthetase TilS [Sedimentisphaerales bacterium]
MLTELEQKVADFITAEQLLSAGERVLLAISGGADSTALLHVMAALKADGVLPVEIYCAHANHQLRGTEALRDQDFVVEQCRKLKIAVIIERIDVLGYARAKKLSIETAARGLRIDSLLEIAARQNCACIATAHQKNDNAETVLHRLIRGTGFRGLCGIWPAKEFTRPGEAPSRSRTGGVRFIRPLLCANRGEIIQYLNSRNLKWCEDMTNEDFAYRRNFIRHRLLPALQKDCGGCLVEELLEMAKVSRGFHRLICRLADAVWPDVAAAEKQTVTLDLGKLVDQPAEVKVELFRRAIALLGCGEQEITERHYGSILRLSEDDKLQLPMGIEVRRQGGAVIFAHSSKKSVETGATEAVALKVPGRTLFGPYTIEADALEIKQNGLDAFKKTKTSFVVWFDFDKLKLPLEVRFRKRGDRFWPLGLPAEKKVGKFLTSAKVSPALRRKTLVVADSEKIIWLCPVRISEQAKIGRQTKTVLQLKITNKYQAQ